jgi:hypothetical protein
MTHRSMSGSPLTWSVVAVALLAAVTFGVVAGGVVPADAGAAPPDPADFDDPQPNPYFPLEPGWSATLRGSEGGDRWVERVVVTDRTKTIQGITTTVVRDLITHRGVPVERTFDWYAADDTGTVWYFGEATVEFDADGDPISTHGSWEAGVDGAVAGVIMPADPRPTDAYRQEFYRGEAEDQGWVVERSVSIRVPYGRVDHAVRTFEWSRLEPRVMVGKIFGPGLGIVREYTVAGGSEQLELVRVREPGSS